MKAVIESPRPPAMAGYDVERIRRDFPILSTRVNGKPLVYLDNAATSQKPQAVIDALINYYSKDNANIHRGVHYLSQKATADYEAVRENIARFINAAEAREIIFVRGTTEGINLLANTFGRQSVREGDEILITALEHHSNIVPWQMLCEEKGAKLLVIPMADNGELVLDDIDKLLSAKTRLVAFTHISNALGSVLPVKEIIKLAHDRGIPVLIDGAQSVPHTRIDVRDLDCDFYVFSGHKMYGPTGVGVLYGKASLLKAMPPYQGGGDMISSVTFEHTDYNEIPYKLEAGTPNIAGVIGLGAAIDYMNAMGVEAIAAHEHELLEYATAVLSEIAEVRLIGTAREKAAVVSFLIDGIHPHDIGTILDQEGIAVRTGHHCAQPIMDRLGIPATARASFAMYNTVEEIDVLARGIRRVIEVFA